MSEGKKLEPGLARSLKIVGGVAGVALLIVVAWVAMRPAPNNPAQAASAQLPRTNGTGIEKDTQPTPQQQRLLREQQMAEAAEKRAQGKPYIPPDTGIPEPLPPQQPGPGPSQVQMYTVGQPAPAPQVNQQLVEEQRAQQERLKRGMDAQLQALVAANAPPQRAERVQFLQPGSGAATTGAAAAGGSGAAGAAKDPGVMVVDSYEIYAAATTSDVDTYKTGFISAQIKAGRLAGAQLYGRTQLVNEGLQPRFNAMRWNGRSYKVNAIALDEQTSTDAVQANLDRRYLQRYVMPVFMATVGAYANAKSQTGSQVVTTAAGSTVSQPAPSERQAVNAGIAAGIQMGQRAVDADAQLPIRATFPSGSPIGIMFIEPVMEEDASSAASKEIGQQTLRDRQQEAATAPARNGLAPAHQQPQQPGPAVIYGQQPMPTGPSVQIQLPLGQQQPQQ